MFILPHYHCLKTSVQAWAPPSRPSLALSHHHHHHHHRRRCTPSTELPKAAGGGTRTRRGFERDAVRVVKLWIGNFFFGDDLCTCVCVCVSFPIFTNWTAVAGKPLRHHHLGLGPMVPWSAQGRRARCGPTVGRPAPTHYGRVGGRRPGIMRRTFNWDVNVTIYIYTHIIYIIYYIYSS